MSTEPRTLEFYRTFLRERITQAMQLEPSTLQDGELFSVYGMGSRHAVELSGALEQLMERRIPATIFYDYPTVSALAQYLLELGES